MGSVYDPPALSRLLDLSADAAAAVMAGQSLTDALARVPAPARPGVQALSFHCLRWWGGASAVRALVAPKPPPPRVDALLTTALALLWPVRSPPYADHTLVDQAVHCARERTPAAAAFVNAVLRRFLRERDALVAAAQRSPEAAWNHRTWWVDRVRRDWPAQWQALLLASNEHPPMTLRVNARRLSGQDYLRKLSALGMAGWLLDSPGLGGQAVQLAKAVPVERLPGFAEGEVSVQDASAQRAATLLLHGTAARALPGSEAMVATARPAPSLPPGARVLDACAAPGGKTAHLLELADLDVLALDSDPVRLARVQETLQRLQLKATVQAGDARQPRQWWDGRPFDAILLDAPCTASGIVRRHPDVRWLRRPDDVPRLVAEQQRLLQALWPLLRPGGHLLYCTCSVFKAEGQAQVDGFVAGHADAQALPAPGHLLPDALPPGGPIGDNGPGGLDGFFYALLRKAPAA